MYYERRELKRNAEQLSTREKLALAMNRPDAKQRQEDLLQTHNTVFYTAADLGIEVYQIGSLASPLLRDHRPHDDVDVFIPHKDECLEFIHELGQIGFVNNSPKVLRGSSLFYLTDPETKVPVEIRYGNPNELANGKVVWEFERPKWTKLVMPKSLVLPQCALSEPGDTRSWNGSDFRYIHDEYNWLIKSKSPYPKDQIDAMLLAQGGLNWNRMQEICSDIDTAGGTLMLPPTLIGIIRKFGFWNLPTEDYRLLHGVN